MEINSGVYLLKLNSLSAFVVDFQSWSCYFGLGLGLGLVNSGLGLGLRNLVLFTSLVKVIGNVTICQSADDFL